MDDFIISINDRCVGPTINQCMKIADNPNDKHYAERVKTTINKFLSGAQYIKMSNDGETINIVCVGPTKHTKNLAMILKARQT